MQVEQPLQEEVLLAQPGMVVVLVRVHRAAEHEHAPVRVERPRQRLAPGEAPLLEVVAARLDDVAEHAGPDALSVNDAENVHQPFGLAGTFADCSSRCKTFALAAACAIRPPRPSGLVALLLKNA